MIRKIVPVTEPKLRQKSKPAAKIDKKVKSLIQDLKDTLVAQDDPEGVGLAAPQIGKNVRIFAIMPKKQIKVFINPKVISKAPITNSPIKIGEDKNDKLMEGCLSLPHYYGPLKRTPKITLKYLNEEGKEKTETFTDFEAHIIDHEIDHLNGDLFIDRLLQAKSRLFKLTKENEWEEVELI